MGAAQQQEPEGFWRRIGPGVAYLAAWIGLSVIGVGLVFEWRIALLHLAIVLQVGMFTLQFVDQSVFIALALGWLVAVGILEGYLRSGLRKRRLGSRAVRVLVAEAILLALAFAIQLLTYT